jgi:hypothetical protein
VDDRRVEASDRDRLAAHDFVPCVQEEDEEVLAGLLAELGTDDPRYVIGTADLR